MSNPIETSAETCIIAVSEKEQLPSVHDTEPQPSRFKGKCIDADVSLTYATGHNNNGSGEIPPVNETEQCSEVIELTEKEDTDSPPSLSSAQELAVNLDCLRVINGSGSDAKVVLQGLDLTLPRGKIYGLLGPSGCGKTTLLRCILGRKQPQEGLIRVLGQIPGRSEASIPGPGVGYMPQELTLYPELTIYETLSFYGKLFGMNETLIRQRIEALIELLELPDRGRLVRFLSGGQQRRVSLAAALIHSPPLLILDEPTVGLDPLLIKKIWDHLVALTADGVTVLVTTHHMEEVREANLVGLMRSGRMLAQDTPSQLLEDFQCDTLGKVFLELCMADRDGRAIVKHEGKLEIVNQKTKESLIGLNELQQPVSDTQQVIKRTKGPETISNGSIYDIKRRETFSDSLSRLFALVMKNLIQTKRNIPLLLFALMAPSLHILLFGHSIGGDPFELPIGVVNLDVHPYLSQPFLESIPNYTIVQRPYADLRQALGSMKRGETWGVLRIGNNFSTALQYRFLLGIDTDNKTINESTMDIYVDSTNQQIRFMLQKTLFESLVAFYEKLLAKNNKNVALAQLPVKIKDPFYGDKQLSVTGFMAPGIILSITFFMAMALTAVSTTREAREGTMERCIVAGVKSFEVISSHVLSQICVMIVQVSFVLVLVFFFFKIPLQGSWILVILLTFLQGLSGMTYGLAISSVCTQEQTAIFLALATFIANLLVSGIIWPIQSMPKVLRTVAYELPQTISTESLRCIMYRGWGLERYEVWIGFVMSLWWPLVFVLFATVLFKFGRDR